MKVSVNGEMHELTAASTVEDLLVALKLQDAPCAVELNRSVVPKADHANTPLGEGDVLEVVTLVGGG